MQGKPRLVQIENGSHQMPAVYLVFVGTAADPIGMLEKYPNTRTDKHPWKAIRGFGMGRKYIGAFYPEQGGKPAALAAVLAG
jgi:hypothetical protein